MKKFIFMIAAVLAAGCAKVEVSRDVYTYDSIRDFDNTLWIAYRIAEEDSGSPDAEPVQRRETIELEMSSRGSYGVCRLDVYMSGDATHELTTMYYDFLSDGYIELSSVGNSSEKIAVCLVNNDRLIVTSWPSSPEYEGLVFIRQN